MRGHPRYYFNVRTAWIIGLATDGSPLPIEAASESAASDPIATIAIQPSVCASDSVFLGWLRVRQGRDARNPSVDTELDWGGVGGVATRAGSPPDAARGVLPNAIAAASRRSRAPSAATASEMYPSTVVFEIASSAAISFEVACFSQTNFRQARCRGERFSIASSMREGREPARRRIDQIWTDLIKTPAHNWLS